MALSSRGCSTQLHDSSLCKATALKKQRRRTWRDPCLHSSRQTSVFPTPSKSHSSTSDTRQDNAVRVPGSRDRPRNKPRHLALIAWHQSKRRRWDKGGGCTHNGRARLDAGCDTGRLLVRRSQGRTAVAESQVILVQIHPADSQMLTDDRLSNSADRHTPAPHRRPQTLVLPSACLLPRSPQRPWWSSCRSLGPLTSASRWKSLAFRSITFLAKSGPG